MAHSHVQVLGYNVRTVTKETTASSAKKRKTELPPGTSIVGNLCEVKEIVAVLPATPDDIEALERKVNDDAVGMKIVPEAKDGSAW